MKLDPVVERVRAARHRISAEHGHDTQRLIRHYKELEKKYSDRMLPPTGRAPAEKPGR